MNLTTNKRYKPKETRGGFRTNHADIRKYPIPDMAVGDTHWQPWSQCTGLRTQLSHYKAKHKGWDYFTVGQTEDGVPNALASFESWGLLAKRIK